MNIKDVTIIVVTSIIPDHPSTEMIEKTIESIRYHFPENEIILQIDGLRKEQEHRKADYDEYKNRILWKCMHQYKNILPLIFDEHLHQTQMMIRTIDIINTSVLLYVEGDAPLVTDEPIDWQKCLDLIDSGQANTIRFHHEGSIPRSHKHLMLGKSDGFMKTIQWSQRPHLSLVSYYRDSVLPNSDPTSFIEDKFHGYVQDDFNLHGTAGWDIHKLWIYAPNNQNIKRSYHLDGRKGTRKFTDDDLHWGFVE
jgi:hypothetical protein